MKAFRSMMDAMYIRYLRRMIDKLVDRNNPRYPVLCPIIKSGAFWSINPSARRLLKEIEKMLIRSYEISSRSYGDTIDAALAEKFALSQQPYNTTQMRYLRVLWLEELILLTQAGVK